MAARNGEEVRSTVAIGSGDRVKYDIDEGDLSIVYIDIDGAAFKGAPDPMGKALEIAKRMSPNQTICLDGIQWYEREVRLGLAQLDRKGIIDALNEYFDHYGLDGMHIYRMGELDEACSKLGIPMVRVATLAADGQFDPRADYFFMNGRIGGPINSKGLGIDLGNILDTWMRQPRDSILDYCKEGHDFGIPRIGDAIRKLNELNARLGLAIYGQDADEMLEALSLGADPNGFDPFGERDYGRRFMHLIGRYPTPEGVGFLLEKGARVCDTDSFGDTPLDALLEYAATYGHTCTEDDFKDMAACYALIKKHGGLHKPIECFMGLSEDAPKHILRLLADGDKAEKFVVRRQ